MRKGRHRSSAIVFFKPLDTPATKRLVRHLQTVRKLPFIVTRGEAGQDEDDKISVTPDGQFCG
jgi:hypothetical protein